MKTKPILLVLFLMITFLSNLIAKEISPYEDLGFPNKEEFTKFTGENGPLDLFLYFYTYCETISKSEYKPKKEETKQIVQKMKKFAKELVDDNKDFASKLNALISKNPLFSSFIAIAEKSEDYGFKDANRDLYLDQITKGEVQNGLNTANGDAPHDFGFEGLAAFRNKYQIVENPETGSFKFKIN